MTIDNGALNPKNQELFKAYKSLPAQKRVAILNAIRKLEQAEAQGTVPSTELMQNLLTQTGEFDIAIACYSAYLRNQLALN